MSDPAGDDPFRHVPPPFGDMLRMMRQQSADPSAQARAFAVQVATDGAVEPNVDPLTRMKVEQLARVAELRVADATGLDVTTRLLPCTRTQFALTTLDEYAVLFDRLRAGLAAPADAAADDDLAGDPMGWLVPMLQAMQPMMLAFSVGSMVGHLAKRSFGSYDLPVPRPAGADVLLVLDNATTFARDWSITEDDLILWLSLDQLLHHAVLGVPHVRDEMDRLLFDYVSSFQASGDVEELLSGFELPGLDDTGDPLSAIQRQLGSPEQMLSLIESDHQREIRPRLHALVAAVEGYVDVLLDHIGEQLIGSYRQTTEALRRRRVEADDATRAVEQFLGLDLSQAQFDRGTRFAEGVVERDGLDALNRLWSVPEALPTPNEIDAPGLWLARLEFL